MATVVIIISILQMRKLKEERLNNLFKSTELRISQAKILIYLCLFCIFPFF